MNTSNKIAIIVEAAECYDLQALAHQMPLWAPDLPHYKNVAGQLRRAGASLTMYSPSASASPEQEFLRLLATVDLHHGSYSSKNPWCVMEVYGVAVTEQISASLKEYGVNTITPTTQGFSASRVATKLPNDT
jgi:hypothetical protein